MAIFIFARLAPLARLEYYYTMQNFLYFILKVFDVANTRIKYYLGLLQFWNMKSLYVSPKLLKPILKHEPWEVKVLFVTCYNLI